MNIRHLSVFLSVCDHMNMTQAASELYMTQPSVSQMIAELERYYETNLFERLNRRLYLTEAGKRLRSYATHIINLEAQVKRELADLNRGGVLRIGASQTVGAYLLPEIIAQFKNRNPDVEVFSRVENSRVIEHLLMEDKLDFGLLEGMIHYPDLSGETFLDDDLAIVCAPGHPLAGISNLVPADLSTHGFIIREEGSGTREVFTTQMQAAGIPWKENGIYNSTDAIKSAVQNNLGLGILPILAIQQEIMDGSIHLISVTGLNLRRKLNLVYHRQKYFTNAMNKFVSHLHLTLKM
jgi:LysR family transcriptional regulator, transcriptional activator of the cysJI operon